MIPFIITFFGTLIAGLSLHFLIQFIERIKLKRLEKKKAKSVEIDFEFI